MNVAISAKRPDRIKRPQLIEASERKALQRKQPPPF